MRRTMMIAISVFALSPNLAFAGEGAGNPFEYITPGVTSVVMPDRLPSGRQDPFPFRAMSRVVTSSPFVLQLSERSEGVVQTNNSLPVAVFPAVMADETPLAGQKRG